MDNCELTYFPTKRATSRGELKFLENFFSWKFPFHLISLPNFPEFSIEWLAFRKFNNFRIFCNFSLDISVPFVLVSKTSKFLVWWRVPGMFLMKISLKAYLAHPVTLTSDVKQRKQRSRQNKENLHRLFHRDKSYIWGSARTAQTKLWLRNTVCLTQSYQISLQ